MRHLLVLVVLYLEIGLFVAARSLHHSWLRAVLSGTDITTNDRHLAYFWVIAWFPYGLACVFAMLVDFIQWTRSFIRST